MKKASIIIPIYNKSQYLNECIDSVINQTIFDDIEVILINDGSTDSSEEICLEYTSRYPNIKYFCQKNHGVSVARNFCLENATGEYVFFMDADDSINDTFIESAFNNGRNNNSDIVVVSNNVGFGNIKLDKICYLATCQCFWKRSFLNAHTDIKFLEGLNNGEDGIFSFELLVFAKNISFENQSIYNYRKVENSLDTRLNDSIYYIQIIHIWLEELSRFYTKNQTEPKIKQNLLRFLACHILYRLVKHHRVFNISQKLNVIKLLANFIKTNKLGFIRFNLVCFKQSYSLLYLLLNSLVLITSLKRGKFDV